VRRATFLRDSNCQLWYCLFVYFQSDTSNFPR